MNAPMAECRIHVKGRSRKLHLNYRTTGEIRKFAMAVVEGGEVDDLDGGKGELRRYKSITHGPCPFRVPFALPPGLPSFSSLL
jgi:hypothetical protein